jgi:hypothetical protein
MVVWRTRRMRKPSKISERVGWFSFVSLACSTLSCIGCSIHEHNRWGQPQDTITFLLAGGAYLFFAVFVLSGIVFVIVLAKEG